MKIRELYITLVMLMMLFHGADALALTECTASSVSSLKSCVASFSQYDQVRLTGDIACNSVSDCCGSAGAPLIDVNQVIGSQQQPKVIDGGMHTVKRSDGQRSCSAIRVHNGSRYVTVKNITFDEDVSDPPCWPSENCPEAVQAHSNTEYFTNNIAFNNIKILNAKANAAACWGVDHFTLTGSTIKSAGIVGLDIGWIAPDWSLAARCKHVLVSGNTFSDVYNNAIAVQGLEGQSVADNLITGNSFVGAHHTGRWGTSVANPNASCDTQGGPPCSGGALVYLASGSFLTFTNNKITHGYCRNCFGNFVGGIEIGDPAFLNNGFPAASDMVISNNTISNIHDYAIHQNPNTSILNFTITGNVFYNNHNLISDPSLNPVSIGFGSRNCSAPSAPCHCTNCQSSPNTDFGTDVMNGFEASDDFPAGWATWSHCATNSIAVRWCPGSANGMDGQCVLRMATGDVTCQDGGEGMWAQGMAKAIGPGQAVNLDMFIRNGEWSGRVCIVAANASFVEIGQKCSPTDPYTSWQYTISLQDIYTWQFAGKELSWVTPAGTAYVFVKVGVTSPNAAIDFDLIRYAY